MNDSQTDSKKLAADASRDAYSSSAKKCFPWSHQWEMWRPGIGEMPLYQYRRCIKCGITKGKFIVDL